MIALFKRYVVHNFGLKILSLLIATFIWIAISPDEQPAEVALRAPIVFQNVPPQLEISSETVPEAQIRVRGPERIIRHLQPNEVHAEIDLANVKPGERTFDLNSQQVRHPREVAIVQVVPSQLHLAFDRRASREIEIHPRVLGNFAEGGLKITVDPSHILISGPQQHVDKVDAAITDPIDAGGLRDSAVFTTNAYVADPLVQISQPTPIRVTVTVKK